MHIQSLHIHPLKSGAIVDLDSVDLNERGLAGDRTMMLVDDQDVFLTQRALPKLAMVRITRANDELVIPGVAPISVCWSDDAFTSPIWKTSARVVAATAEANEALSTYLGHTVRLVRIADDPQRFASANWAPQGTAMALQDGYPILVACTASLQALNDAIAAGPNGPDASVPMNRFRPNVVIETTEPWIEDTWRRVRLGDVVLDFLKPCQRCVLTTRDQLTGIATNNEPSRTLMKLRRSTHPDQKGLMFAWNAVRVSGNHLAVGDQVEVLDSDPAGWPIAPVA
ncbi:MAG: MOSC N-terminal beta barrel domain-containing protein [Pseudomonadota bacterium]